MALGINPVLASTAQIKIAKMGVPTDLPHENRVSQFAKNTAKQSVAATNRREEGFDIPKSRKKIVSYTDLVSWIVQCTRYKVPSKSSHLDLNSAYRSAVGRHFKRKITACYFLNFFTCFSLLI